MDEMGKGVPRPFESISDSRHGFEPVRTSGWEKSEMKRGERRNDVDGTLGSQSLDFRSDTDRGYSNPDLSAVVESSDRNLSVPYWAMGLRRVSLPRTVYGESMVQFALSLYHQNRLYTSSDNLF